MNSQEIDDLDFRIIAQLQDDGRKSATDMARELGVPRTTIARRLDRLIRDKVLTVGAFADGAKIGLPVQVMIELWVDPARHGAVISTLSNLEEIRWIGIASGPFDVMVEAMVRSSVLPRNGLDRRLLPINCRSSL